MSMEQVVKDTWRISIFRHGELSGIKEEVSADNVLELSSTFKEIENGLGRPDSVVEFEQEKKKK